jgi:hypothetical protein
VEGDRVVVIHGDVFSAHNTRPHSRI